MIRHYSQLAASPAEPLLSAIEAELLEKGWARERGLGWDDRVCAFVDESGRVLAAISWRHYPGRRSAWVTMGGTREGYRHIGLYRAVFLGLVEHLREHRPEIQIIESGHHVDNGASEAMHLAFGRTLAGKTYEFQLKEE
jgi:hypothetical protein